MSRLRAGRAAGGSTHPVLVIGGGHNGLVCAIKLLEAGIPAIVLERSANPGGAVHSHEDGPAGFVHDGCAGFFPLTAASPAFRDIPLERHGVRWVNPPVAAAHPFLDGPSIVLHRELEETCASLDRVAPGDGEAWCAFVAPLLAHREAFVGTALGRFPPLRSAASLLLGLRRRVVELGRRGVGSPASWRPGVFSSRRSTAWLAGSAMHAGIDPYAAGGGGFGLLLMLLAHSVGWPFPEGGARRLSEGLAARVVELGGEVRCSAQVGEILIGAERAQGLRLVGGEVLEGSAIVATVTARPLAEMLPEQAPPSRILSRLRRWRYGPGVCKLDFALERAVPWQDESCREAGVVHVGDSEEAIARSLQAARRGDVPDEPALVVGQHSLHDPTRAPSGKHTLYVYTHVGADPSIDGERIADRIERRIESFAPGFRDSVIGRSIRTPARLEAENPSLVDGDLLGGSADLDQLLIFRPTPELLRYRTPLRGLYVGGASVHPGGGAHGMCGAGAARAVISDRTGLRRR